MPGLGLFSLIAIELHVLWAKMGVRRKTKISKSKLFALELADRNHAEKFPV